MNRRALAVAAACAVLTAGVVFLVVFMRSAPAPETAAEEATPSSVSPVDAEPEAPSRPWDAPPAADRAPAGAAAPAPPAPRTGTLRIETDVPGAHVFLDRQFIGTTPLTAENVTPGTRQLNVSADGFEGVAQTIDVTPGPREIVIRFREVRLNAAIDVVHRHRIGSCQGRLVANAHGMRYETAHADDAFSVALTDLEAFQVDYLDRNLNVRLRGRQYNFTDPDGNADRLFVFHRDVDRARERLAAGDPPATD